MNATKQDWKLFRQRLPQGFSQDLRDALGFLMGR